MHVNYQEEIHEFRTEKRFRSLLGAKVIIKNKDSSIHCTIKNFSAHGMLVKFESCQILPQSVEINIFKYNLVVQGQVVWQKGIFAGIKADRPIKEFLLDNYKI